MRWVTTLRTILVLAFVVLSYNTVLSNSPGRSLNRPQENHQSLEARVDPSQCFNTCVNAACSVPSQIFQPGKMILGVTKGAGCAVMCACACGIAYSIDPRSISERTEPHISVSKFSDALWNKNMPQSDYTMNSSGDKYDSLADKLRHKIVSGNDLASYNGIYVLSTKNLDELLSSSISKYGGGKGEFFWLHGDNYYLINGADLQHSYRTDSKRQVIDPGLCVVPCSRGCDNGEKNCNDTSGFYDQVCYDDRNLECHNYDFHCKQTCNQQCV